MFNPSQQNSQPEAIWDLLGTFFALLPEDDKRVFETYYEALSRDNSALFYSLYQAENLRYFKEQEGWYEFISQEYSLIKEDHRDSGRENLKEIFVKSPRDLEASFNAGNNTYSYKVTALNSEGETLPSQKITIENVLLDGTNPVNLS